MFRFRSISITFPATTTSSKTLELWYFIIKEHLSPENTSQTEKCFEKLCLPTKCFSCSRFLQTRQGKQRRACRGKWAAFKMSDEMVQPFQRLGVTREALLYKPQSLTISAWPRRKINLPAKWQKDNKDIRMEAGCKLSQMSLHHNDNINVCAEVSINHELHRGWLPNLNFISMHNLIFPNSCSG